MTNPYSVAGADYAAQTAASPGSQIVGSLLQDGIFPNERRGGHAYEVDFAGCRFAKANRIKVKSVRSQTPIQFGTGYPATIQAWINAFNAQIAEFCDALSWERSVGNGALVRWDTTSFRFYLYSTIGDTTAEAAAWCQTSIDSNRYLYGCRVLNNTSYPLGYVPVQHLTIRTNRDGVLTGTPDEMGPQAALNSGNQLTLSVPDDTFSVLGGQYGVAYFPFFGFARRIPSYDSVERMFSTGRFGF